MSFKDKVKKSLFEGVPREFVDPITKSLPANEAQLSALLCHFHHHNNIDWAKVRLYSVENKFSGKTAEQVISKTNPLYCEYPLFASDGEKNRIWGQMSADI